MVRAEEKVHALEKSCRVGLDAKRHIDDLQDTEEVYEVLFLFVREPNLEAAIEEVHQFGQIPGGTIGEVGRAGGESAELLHQDGADVRAFSGDECTAGVLS